MTAEADAAWLAILRLLPPRSLGVSACVCRAWAAHAESLFARDVSRRREGVLLLAPSAADASELSATFAYCPVSAWAEENVSGGGCADCSSDTSEHALLGWECGPACACTAAPLLCRLRATQRPVTQPLSLRRVPGAGWGVFADTVVERGAFVCLYAGEVLTTEAARARFAEQDAAGSMNFVMVLREHTRDGTMVSCIDPSRAGNVGRFINHACGDAANLDLRLVRSAGWPLPRAAFFACRRIQAGQELRYSYGVGGKTGRTRCGCGGRECTGWLPDERAV